LEGITVGEKIKYIHVDFKEMGRVGVDWIHLAQDRAERWTFVFDELRNIFISLSS
jgi:hypothetical protein